MPASRKPYGRHVQHPQGTVAVQPAAGAARYPRPAGRAQRRRRVPAGSAGQARSQRPPPHRMARDVAARVPHPRGLPERLRHERRVPARPPRQRGGEPAPDPGVGEHRHLAPPHREPGAAALRARGGGMEGARALHQRAPGPVGQEPPLPARVDLRAHPRGGAEGRARSSSPATSTTGRSARATISPRSSGSTRSSSSPKAGSRRAIPRSCPSSRWTASTCATSTSTAVQRLTGAAWSRLSDHVALSARLSR